MKGRGSAHRSNGTQRSLFGTSTREVYRDIRNYLAGRLVGATRDATLLEEVIKCLFCRLHLMRQRRVPALSDSSGAVASRYAQALSELQAFLPATFADRVSFLLDPESLSYVNAMLETVDFSDWSSDPFGDAYESFTGSSARGHEGQFFTPLNAVELLASMVDPSPGERVIDPACGSGSAQIQGFATDISYDQGQTTVFKINTPATSYRLDIYRMGYYAGNGARKVATVNPSASLPQSQPACLTNSATGLVDCGNWASSASWSIPSTAVSGIYFAKLVRTDGTEGNSHVFFVVRDDDGAAPILLQTSDATWQAYNRYGGKSLYFPSSSRAYKVSYNRPFDTRAFHRADWVFNAEYPMVRFLEANGYDLSYSSGVDTERSGTELLEHQV